VSTVSSRNVCRASVDTDSAAEQVLMNILYYLVSIGIGYSWFCCVW